MTTPETLKDKDLLDEYTRLVTLVATKNAQLCYPLQPVHDLVDNERYFDCKREILKRMEVQRPG